jgi:hypothetical protein
MKLWTFGAWSLTLGATLSLALLAGCGSDKTQPSGKDGDAKKDEAGKDDDTTPKKERKVLTSGKAVVKGTVKYDGDYPTAMIEKMNADVTKTINEKALASDKDHCLCKDKACGGDNEQQVWRINKENMGLKNAVVFLIPEPGDTFACSDSDPGVEAVKGKEFKVTQPFCAFHPHAGVIFPAYRDKDKKTHMTDQKLVVYNDTDKTKPGGIFHNTKWSGPSGSGLPTGNVGIPKGEHITVADLESTYRGPLSLQCNAHQWMNASIWVLDHPYFAVTDENGAYEIKNAPAGKVRIIAWHEGVEGKEGNYMNKGGYKGEPIELKDGETKLDFKGAASK